MPSSKKAAQPRIKNGAKPKADRTTAGSLKLLAYAEPFHVVNERDAQTFAVLGFQDRKGRERKQIVPAGFLVSNPRRLIDYLADRGYQWSREPMKECKTLMAARTDKLTSITCVPGWHGDAYARPKGWFGSPNGDNTPLFIGMPDVKLGAFLSKGSLRGWKSRVAKVARCSSLVRLFLALPFAATALRLTGGKSFGIVVVGPSTVGKTLLLRMAASVMGHNGPSGLTSLDASPSGIEQLILGHRDGFLPLDELGHIVGNAASAAELLKWLSFQGTSGQRRNRAAHYEAMIGTIKPDTRVVFGVTSELSLANIAARGKQERLLGEQVRLIEVPALLNGAKDIFDGRNAAGFVGKNLAERISAVNQLEKACNEEQGHAHRQFLEKLCVDPEAPAKLNQRIRIFSKHAAPLLTDPSRGRVMAPFAITYAAARLAIDYGLLPWEAKPTRKALLRCLRSALAQMNTSPAGEETNTSPKSEDEIAAEFLNRLRAANVADRNEPLADKLQSAEVIRKGPGKQGAEFLLKPDTFRVWYPDAPERNAIANTLVRRGIMLPGRDTSTHTVQIKIATLGKKKRSYYRICAGTPRM